MRVVAISDTHNRHARIEIGRCDLLLHAGDLTGGGTFKELEAFLRWFAEQPAEHRVFIAGNHDRCVEREPTRVRAMAKAFGVTYVEDEAVEVGPLRLWGSPVTPRFRNMAFNRRRGSEIAAHWKDIPAGLDVLVTHTPPRGILDRMFLGQHIGCDDLRRRVTELAPKFHVFGHVHEAHGEATVGQTQFINAASSRLLRRTPRPAVTFEV